MSTIVFETDRLFLSSNQLLFRQQRRPVQDRGCDSVVAAWSGLSHASQWQCIVRIHGTTLEWELWRTLIKSCPSDPLFTRNPIYWSGIEFGPPWLETSNHIKSGRVLQKANLRFGVGVREILQYFVYLWSFCNDTHPIYYVIRDKHHIFSYAVI